MRLIRSFFLFSLLLVTSTVSGGNEANSLNTKYANKENSTEDINVSILEMSDDENIRAMLRHYAYFTEEFVNNAGFAQAKSFVQLAEVELCIGFENKKWLIAIQSSVLTSDEKKSKYIESEKAMKERPWIASTVYPTDCNYEIPNYEYEFSYSVRSAFEEDICKNIPAKTEFDYDTIAQEEYKKCEAAKISWQ